MTITVVQSNNGTASTGQPWNASFGAGTVTR
jgi:hypothetical protein